MADALQHVDLRDAQFWVAVAAIVFNPFFWNVVARWEHQTRVLTRLFGGPYVACYSLAFLILLLNVYRSHSITAAMKAQARCELLEALPVFYAGSALMALGSVLVLSSFFALGFTGTFLGDYFGILMEEKVTGFPFNIMDNPMYWGSTANYLGLALINASPVGLVLTAVVSLSYQVAILFEGPFTEEIYRQRMRCAKQGFKGQRFELGRWALNIECSLDDYLVNTLIDAPHWGGVLQKWDQFFSGVMR